MKRTSHGESFSSDSANISAHDSIPETSMPAGDKSSVSGNAIELQYADDAD